MAARAKKQMCPFHAETLLLVVVIALFSISNHLVVALDDNEECSGATQSTTTQEGRAKLFEYLFESTLKREAFSPIKNQNPGINISEAMLKEHHHFINAQSDQDLWFALVRLSNARKDRHLSVRPTDGGLWLDDYWGPRPSRIYQPPLKETPIQFGMDYTDNRVFVSNVGVVNHDEHDATSLDGVEIGDTLVGVNNVPIETYIQALEPYVCYSTQNGFLTKVAERMNQWNYQTPPSFYQGNGKSMTYTLQRRLNGSEYEITFPFVPHDEIEWREYGQPKYPGFIWMKSLQCFSLYVHESKRVLLLQWHGFDDDLIEDIEYLMEYASNDTLLNYDTIMDLTKSRGGSKAPYVVQHLSPHSFKTTFGNLRLSDISQGFVNRQTKLNLGYYAKPTKDSGDVMNDASNTVLDDGTWLMDWLETCVVPALRKKRQAYTNNVPFKLAHAPFYSDGILHPAPIHFKGRMVVLLSPYGGSQVDQFASIVVDNDLAHTIGMSAGGFSNTWDWSEVLENNGNPLVKYMWTIGQTIRPNGEVLEGNPAKVKEFVPQTRANVLSYQDELVERAMRYLGLAEGQCNDE